MSGKVGDGLGTSSGLVKSATDAPDSGSSDPGTDENPSAVGDRFINTTSGELFVCTDATTDDNVWKGQLGTDVELAKWYGERGIFFGGTTTNEINYITISTPGNSTDFGNLASGNRNWIVGVSNGTRGIGGMGYVSGVVNTLEYITTATTGNATDFGESTLAGYHGSGAVSNGTRGVWGGRSDNVTMDYVTIATAGNATDFGDQAVIENNAGSGSNGTRGVWGGGDN